MAVTDTGTDRPHWQVGSARRKSSAGHPAVRGPAHQCAGGTQPRVRTAGQSTADRADHVRVHHGTGCGVIENQLIELRDRGPLRVITMTYMGRQQYGTACPGRTSGVGSAQVRITYEFNASLRTRRRGCSGATFARHPRSWAPNLSCLALAGRFERECAAIRGSPPGNSSASSGPPSISLLVGPLPHDPFIRTRTASSYVRTAAGGRFRGDDRR